MKLTVKLFGPYAKAANVSSVTLDFSGDVKVTVGDVMAKLAADYAQLKPLLPAAKLAVDCGYVPLDCQVTAADELAVIGMVGGG